MTILIAIAVALAALVLFVLLTYNRLVRLRLAAESSWAQIDVALRLRHDLVPALANAVGGYASHERATFDEVARARSGAIDAVDAAPGERGAAEGVLGAGVGRMLAVAEDYPDLRASENFAALQSQLAEVEERISITRRVYNDTVETYNTAIQVFPPVLVARALGFGRRQFFDAPIEADAAPAIDVGGPGATR